MNDTCAQPAPASEELIPMAMEALADSPIYVDHICNLLSSSGTCFRSGDDQTGLGSFARGTSDLDQFLRLFDQIMTVSCPTNTIATNAFREDINASIHALEQALISQDLVTMSDEIESRLVPILQRWDDVLQELHAGFRNQQI